MSSDLAQTAVPSQLASRCHFAHVVEHRVPVKRPRKPASRSPRRGHEVVALESRAASAPMSGYSATGASPCTGRDADALRSSGCHTQLGERQALFRCSSRSIDEDSGRVVGSSSKRRSSARPPRADVLAHPIRPRSMSAPTAPRVGHRRADARAPRPAGRETSSRTLGSPARGRRLVGVEGFGRGDTRAGHVAMRSREPARNLEEDSPSRPT